MRRHVIPWLIAFAALAAFVQVMIVAPKPTLAMPPFAQAYGLQCSACHTMVPLLNAYGRYVQRTGYASLDRQVLKRAQPVWLGEAVTYDSTLGAGTGTPRYSFGNFAIHAVGYLAPDITFHAQQFIVDGDQSGGLDTLWVTYNNLFHRDGHLFVGKILNPAPSAYGQTSDIDGPAASATLVGEHDWGSTYDNRWGTRLAYVHKALDAEAGYYLSNFDLNGATAFGAGDKTFEWKLAYALATRPYEFGIFGSAGSIPVSTGLDRYSSVAGYAQIDPSPNGRPGLLAVYQSQRDDNPGLDPDGNPLLTTNSRGSSFEIFEPVLHGNLVLSYRHDFNGIGSGFSNGNSLNAAFNVPGFNYLHGYLEANVGGSSALSDASGGPTWKGILWLTLPISSVK